jgi:hypothetical protein
MLVGTGQLMRGLGIAGLFASAMVISLSGCIGVNPNAVAPVALKGDGGDLLLAFCEPGLVVSIVVSQRVRIDGRLTDWVRLYEGEFESQVEPLNVLSLMSNPVAEPRTNLLDEFNRAVGTQYSVTVELQDGQRSGYGGMFESPGVSWTEEMWLPTQSTPTETPCEFWDEWTGGG